MQGFVGVAFSGNGEPAKVSEDNPTKVDLVYTSVSQSPSVPAANSVSSVDSRVVADVSASSSVSLSHTGTAKVSATASTSLVAFGSAPSVTPSRTPSPTMSVDLLSKEFEAKNPGINAPDAKSQREGAVVSRRRCMRLGSWADVCVYENMCYDKTWWYLISDRVKGSGSPGTWVSARAGSVRDFKTGVIYPELRVPPLGSTFFPYQSEGEFSDAESLEGQDGDENALALSMCRVFREVHSSRPIGEHDEVWLHQVDG
jgi:hypothetical protein